MSTDLAAEWLAGRAVDLPEEPKPHPRAVKGHTCKRGHRWTEQSTKWEPNYNGTLIRKCRICRNERERRRRADPERSRKRYEAAAAARARLAATVLAPDDPKHGSLNAYNNYRCRCDACRASYRAYRNDLKARRASEAEHAELVRRRAVSVRAVSLDDRAERRFGMDRVLTGSTFDDPVFDEISGRVA